jgi:hypothetical protein
MHNIAVPHNFDVASAPGEKTNAATAFSAPALIRLHIMSKFLK